MEEKKVILSIVIVNYKTLEFTDKLLASIFDKSSGYDPKNMEIIVLDNGSQDDCGVMVKNKYPQVVFLQNEVNTGFSGGYNRCIDQSVGKHVLVLNSDMEMRKGCVSEVFKVINSFKLGSPIRSGMTQNADEYVLAGKLIFPDGTVQDSCFNLPTPWRAFEEYFLGRKGSYFMSAPTSDKMVQVEGAVAACWLLPRKVIEKVGLLDDRTFLYFEDIEYCRRLKKFGVPIYYCPNIELTHYHGMASKQMGVKESFDFLKKGSKYYHGIVNYALLYVILWLGQRIGRVETPVSRWKKE